MGDVKLFLFFSPFLDDKNLFFGCPGYGHAGHQASLGWCI